METLGHMIGGSRKKEKYDLGSETTWKKEGEMCKFIEGFEEHNVLYSAKV